MALETSDLDWAASDERLYSTHQFRCLGFRLCSTPRSSPDTSEKCLLLDLAPSSPYEVVDNVSAVRVNGRLTNTRRSEGIRSVQ
jgi:hypothetical protein